MLSKDVPMLLWSDDLDITDRDRSPEVYSAFWFLRYLMPENVKIWDTLFLTTRSMRSGANGQRWKGLESGEDGYLQYALHSQSSLQNAANDFKLVLLQLEETEIYDDRNVVIGPDSQAALLSSYRNWLKLSLQSHGTNPNKVLIIEFL